jgi:hypothetical protein
MRRELVRRLLRELLAIVRVAALPQLSLAVCLPFLHLHLQTAAELATCDARSCGCLRLRCSQL